MFPGPETPYTSLMIMPYLISTPQFKDSRGFFEETFRDEWFPEIRFNKIQINRSFSTEKVIRGLHFNIVPTFKIVRCLRGSILDLALDLRSNSETFGKYRSYKLFAQNRELLVIPGGFAHGFQVMSSEAEIIYVVNTIYDPNDDFAINPLDPDLNIKWGQDEKLILSDKDKNGMSWKEFLSFQKSNSLKWS